MIMMEETGKMMAAALLILGMTATVSAQPSEKFHYTFNGSCPPEDVSGNNNDGTCYGGLGTGVSGQFGDAFSFEGDNSGQYVDTGFSPDWTTSKSISFWYNPDTINDDNIIGADDGGYDWMVTHNNGFLAMFTGSGEVNSNVQPSTGTWYHVVAVWDLNNDKAIMYVNGNEELNSGTISSTTTSANFLIGGNSADSGGVREGSIVDAKIDEPRLYNGVLTQEEANTLMNKNTLNTAPVFDSVFTSPSSWTVGSGVDVSADVSDGDGSVSGVSADVWEDGSLIASGVSLSDSDGDGVWEADNLFSVDESGVYYNYTLTATDDDGATATYEDSQLIKNLDPKINHLKPENNSDKFSYSNDYEILIKDDGDNVPDENISCDLYSNGEEFRSVWAFENESEQERTFTGTLNEDVGSNEFKTRCVDGDVTNTTTDYQTRYSSVEDVYSPSTVFETENRSFDLDLKVGDMVNSADFTLSYDGAVEDTKEMASTGIETLQSNLYHEVPLVDSNQTVKDWRIEYDLNIDNFDSSNTSTVQNQTSIQNQEVLWSYYIEKAETSPSNGRYIETEDLKHDVKLQTETKKAEITGTTTYTRNGETDEMSETLVQEDYTDLRGQIDVGKADTFNKSEFQVSSDIELEFNGETRTVSTSDDLVEVYRILLTDGSTSLDTAEALKFDVDYEEENYDTKTKLTMDLSLWKNRDEKIRRYQFQEEPAQTHSYNIYPAWAEYKIRTLPYPEQKKFDLIQYFNQETGKVRRSYFFPTVQTINNQTTKVPLKTINASETTAIDFEITNEDGDPAEDTYCRVDRKFGGGDFETVFQIKTGSEGKSQSFAEVNEIYYGFTCYQNEEIADEFSAQIMQNPMRLQLGGATVETSLDYYSKFDASCTSNTTTLECDYQSDTEKLEEAQLTVERNEVKQDIQVCQTSSPTSTGKLVCNGLNTTKNSYNYELLGLYAETSVQGESGTLGTQSKPIPGAGLFMTAILFMLTTAATAFDLRVGIASGTLVFILTSMINWIALNPSQQATLIGMAIIAGVAVSQ